MAVSKKIVLHFPRRSIERPIIWHLARDYALEFNIIKASISPEQEGLMVIELTGKPEDYDKGIDFLVKAGVKIQSLSQDITRNEDRCTQCGACVTICPANAFSIDPKNRKVIFDNEKCLACGLCLKACPPHAMEVHF
ncbi:MAG: 4Fe-4S binding protein [Dehalococcoidales bacterium]|nr:4Fe-4S binding protein [Dehalococcoidales bacterium]